MAPKRMKRKRPSGKQVRVKIGTTLPVTVFKEAVAIFFEECLRRGTLDDALASLGWIKNPKGAIGWIPPQVIAHTQIPIPLPTAV